MLKELASLSSGMLSRGGYLTPEATPRRAAPTAPAAAGEQPRAPTHRWAAPAETAMLVTIWLATPAMVFVAIAGLLLPG